LFRSSLAVLPLIRAGAWRLTDVIARAPPAPCAGDRLAMTRTYVPIRHRLGQPMVRTPGQTMARPPAKGMDRRPPEAHTDQRTPEGDFPPRMTWRPRWGDPVPHGRGRAERSASLSRADHDRRAVL